MKRMCICEEYRHNRSIKNHITNIKFHVMYLYLYMILYATINTYPLTHNIYTSSDVSTSTIVNLDDLCILVLSKLRTRKLLANSQELFPTTRILKGPLFVGQLDSDNKKHHPPTQAYVSILSKVLWRIWCKMRIYLRNSRGDLPFYGTNLPKYGAPFGLYIRMCHIRNIYIYKI